MTVPTVEARAFEQTLELLASTLKTNINPSPGESGPWGPYVLQTFPDYVVYEWQGKTWQVEYSIDVNDGKSSVTLGDPVEVMVTYAAVTEAEEAAIGEGFIALSEKAVSKSGTAEIKLIQPGWGSSGYYPAKVLERDGPVVFKAGTKMYWDHPTASEEVERPERSLRDLAAELTEDAKFLKDGPEGAGLYAAAKVFEPFTQAVETLAPHIGVSIRAIGMAKDGIVEGRKGKVIERLTQGRSVDFVTEPGAGGQIVQLFESARAKAPASPQHQEDEMDEAKIQEAITNGIAAAVAPLKESVEKLTTDNARLREALVISEARDFVAAELAKTGLPTITRTRLAESLAGETPMKDEKLDREALAEKVKAAVEAERDYLGKVTGSPIRNMNSTPAEVDEAKASEELAGTFGRLGLSESASKTAAAGRN